MTLGTVQSDIAKKIIDILLQQECSKNEIAKQLGKTGRTRYLNDLMKKLLREELVEYTIPEKPKSRLQKYRIKKKGSVIL